MRREYARSSYRKKKKEMSEKEGGGEISTESVIGEHSYRVTAAQVVRSHHKSARENYAKIRDSLDRNV